MTTPYRTQSVPPDKCPDCLHSCGAHNPSQATMDAYCVSVGMSKVSRIKPRIKPPRCHVAVKSGEHYASCPCTRTR